MDKPQNQDAPPVQMKFCRNALATLKHTESIFLQRSNQYGDSYGDCQWLTLRSVFKELTGNELPLEFCSAIAVAGFIDQKYARLMGGWRPDNLDDCINYQAFLLEEMRILKCNKETKTNQSA